MARSFKLILQAVRRCVRYSFAVLPANTQSGVRAGVDSSKKMDKKKELCFELAAVVRKVSGSLAS